MKLVLMRHGKAEAHAAGGDEARPLAPRGRSDARAAAQALAETGLRLDLALVSPARRTQETWEEVRPVLGGQGETVRSLYMAEPETILEEISLAAREGLAIAVIGHNPGMGELALALAERAGGPPGVLAALRGGYPTSSALLLDWGPGPGAPTVSGLASGGKFNLD